VDGGAGTRRSTQRQLNANKALQLCFTPHLVARRLLKIDAERLSRGLNGVGLCAAAEAESSTRD